MQSAHILLKGIPRPIYNITPFTLLDYPDKTACIIWFAGCNMRCGYCYNPEIVRGKGKLNINQALEFIYSRRKLLDGIVFSGGECTLHPELYPLIKTCKKLGFKVKLDTNGSLPKRLKPLLDEGLIDYVAMDFKALPDQYKKITGSNLYQEFEQSLHLLQKTGIDFEIRTTVHSKLIAHDSLKKMVNHLEMLDYKGNYYIQPFLNNTPTLVPLPKSKGIQNLSSLSTSKINVVLR
ncbi:anaerobic ribonucleoside-triphosphate reductase activating protein [Echinicola marina]|uniref:anaerobic ribonucleoside-triphosphate reductase activating protein n=1 Tax=Echinicola marina TaxID=2859768 RepID=UPI001CF6A78B|nr:anaerobic ribonucleoside-triphosphate reductase activating protein [Echinicola marina]UCS93320.1 anaerobic ribonucleoside-triphosphate reductase activating protein [Echinicola marina]